MCVCVCVCVCVLIAKVMSLCTIGTRTFQRVKRPGLGADHPPTSKRRGHGRVELCLYSSSESS